MEFKITHNSKSTALRLAPARRRLLVERRAEEILKNVVLKRTFWLLFRASGKRNSGFGAESPNASLSRNAEIVEKDSKTIFRGLGLKAPTLYSAARLKL